jgi:hypothetical protein
MREFPYYPTVENWLLTRGGCFAAGQNCGSRLAHADVVGVRHVGGDLSADYELIAVEVKTDEPFFKSVSQAAGYSVFAHRCYLAEYERGTKAFTREQVEVALSLGVGLLKVRSRSKGSVEEFLSAPARPARHRFVLQMMETLGLAECILCRGPFRGTYKSGVKRADRNDVKLMLRRALEASANGDPTGYLFWSDGAVDKKSAAGDTSRDTARRYICPDCLRNIVGPLINDE